MRYTDLRPGMMVKTTYLAEWPDRGRRDVLVLEPRPYNSKVKWTYRSGIEMTAYINNRNILHPVRNPCIVQRVS